MVDALYMTLVGHLTDLKNDFRNLQKSPNAAEINETVTNNSHSDCDNWTTVGTVFRHINSKTE